MSDDHQSWFVRSRLRILALALVAGLLGFSVTLLAMREGPAKSEVLPVEAAGPKEPPQGFDQALRDIKATVTTDEATQRFTGQLGDFLVFNDGRRPPASDPCNLASTAESPLPSELNISGMYEQGVCPDGRVLNVYSTLGSRRYFRGGMPEVFADAPKDRLVLMEVDGHLGLAVKPVPDFRPWVLYVIQRPDTGSKPGILITVVVPRGGLNQALSNARAILSQ